MAQSRHVLVDLAKGMVDELNTFSMQWDSEQNKEIFVKSIGKYSKLKKENRPLYDKIKVHLSLTDGCLNDLTMHLIQNHSGRNGLSTSANAGHITAMGDLVIEEYLKVRMKIIIINNHF